MMGTQKRNWLVFILAGLVIAAVSVVLVLRMEHPYGSVPALILRYHTSIPGGTPEQADRVSLGKTDTLVHVTVYIPHTTLPLTRYNVSLVTPSTRHLQLPSLRLSHKSLSGMDTLYLDLDRSYLAIVPGKYTLILNEIFVEPPNTDEHPGVYLYPFSVEER